MDRKVIFCIRAVQEVWSENISERSDVCIFEMTVVLCQSVHAKQLKNFLELNDTVICKSVKVFLFFELEDLFRSLIPVCFRN